MKRLILKDWRCIFDMVGGVRAYLMYLCDSARYIKSKYEF
jgi:hypothetical protein